MIFSTEISFCGPETNQKQLTLMLQSTDSVEKRKAEIDTSPSSLRICVQIVMLQVNFK